MKVSVALITCNHGAFIAQAIESVLMQETDFEHELIIGEDGSTDGTREIVLDFAKRYPGKIRVLLQDQDKVIYLYGRRTGRWNFATTLKAAKGEYVALLEGDDYWTSPRKLRMQVDYLERNPSCSICMHNAWMSSPTGDEDWKWTMFKEVKKIYTLADLLAGTFAPLLGSVMYRNYPMEDFPKWFYEAPAGDFPLYVLNGERGNFGFIDEHMGVYRIHRGGIHSEGIALREQRSPEAMMRRLHRSLRLFSLIRRNVGRKYHAIVKARESAIHYDLVWLCQQNGDFAGMRRHILRAFRLRLLPAGVSFGYRWRSLVIAFFPFIYRLLKRFGGGTAAAMGGADTTRRSKP